MEEERLESRYVVEGQERWAIVHNQSATEVVFAFHGSAESRWDNEHDISPARRFEESYDARYFGKHREKHGYTMVYIAARRNSFGWYCWENNGEEFGSCAYDDRDGNDAALVAAIMDDFRQPNVSTKFYGLGFSGGAKFLWKNRDVFDAVGPIAGASAPSLFNADDEGSCTPVVAFHGDKDSYVDVDSDRATIGWYQQACGCQGKSVREVAENVTLHSYSDCGDPSQYIHYYELGGVGHVIPGAPFIWSGLGPTSDFDSLEAIWDTWQAQGSAAAMGQTQPLLFPLTLIVTACLVLWRQQS
mmetsp:Transcript_6513/g.9471  ORF Transcript_6513/g.9471 Transcript_6513/m.9471 type:complete len:301 (-) Transcript_6513:43-945(-)